MQSKLNLKQIIELVESNTTLQFLNYRFPDINIIRKVFDDRIVLWINKDGEIFNYSLSFIQGYNSILVNIDYNTTYTRGLCTITELNSSKDCLKIIRSVLSFYLHSIYSGSKYYSGKNLEIEFLSYYNDYYNKKQNHNDYIAYFDNKTLSEFNNHNDKDIFKLSSLPKQRKRELFLQFITFGLFKAKWYYNLKKINNG